MAANAAAPQLTPEEEQDKLVEEAKNVVNVQAFYMKRCLDNGKLMDALKHASNMISELRTSLLSPKTYYSLYITVFDHLRHLEIYLFEEKHGKKMSELYELVQYAGNILPRLYLLVTVGSVYVKAKEASAKDVLRDLVEMCRGVQHPTRGLFLRNYLSEMLKDKLPDVGSEADKGDVTDSVDFILQNFTEMNKLWVRMQHQGPVRDKDRRESERLELRILVGKNLSRVSQLEGVDQKMYMTTVLPRVLEQITSCKDKIAQQYLMEVLIQIFPDEFHLVTLEQILAACGQLQPGVDVKTIIGSLIDRLAQFAVKSPDTIPTNIDIFDTFFVHVGKVIEQRPNMEVTDVLSLQVSLLNLSLKCYPTKLNYVDQVLGFCGTYLEGLKAKEKVSEYSKPNPVKQIINLLTIPLDNYKNVLTVLKLTNYKKLTDYLAYQSRKKVAIDTVKNTIDNETIIGEPEDAEKLLDLIQPLIKDEADQPPADDVDKEDFEEEQNRVAAVVHTFDSEDPGKLYKIYLTARKFFTQGGSLRIRHTLIPLAFRALRLVSKIKDQRASGALQLDDEDWNKIGKKLFQFVHETVTAISNIKLSEESLRLYLQAAQAASYCEFETISYEFLTRAFTIYEEEISESKAQFNAITLIIGTLQTLTCFSDENCDTLVTKVAQYSAKLLKKPDQGRAVASVSHLFWVSTPNREYKDGKRVLECLQRSLKIAGLSMDATTNVNLFVEILNEYLYYFDNKNTEVPAKHISSLIQLINTNLANVDPAASTLNTFYQNTLEYIKSKKESTPEYAEIEL